jgi:hypothetical protein
MGGRAGGWRVRWGRATERGRAGPRVPAIGSWKLEAKGRDGPLARLLGSGNRARTPRRCVPTHGILATERGHASRVFLTLEAGSWKLEAKGRGKLK